MNNKNVIRVFEHQTLKVDSESKFKSSHFRALEVYGYKTKEKYFSVGNNRIKFSNYVGVIQVNNLTIEILPKADFSENSEETQNKWHNALLEMLNVCKLIKLDSITNAKLKLKSATILDLYFDLFLTETERIARHGFKKAYRNISENINKVKGKIKFERQIKFNYIHKEKFFVEHCIYDNDHLLNRIILKALVILSKLSNNPLFINRINKLLLYFENISEVNISENDFSKIIFNRSSERYQQAIQLAKLIILKYSPDLKCGKENVLAILFDMNILYETYIYRKIKLLEININISNIKVHKQKRKPFWENRGIRADIIIETNNKNYVIDTKWKLLKEDKPSDSDLKQMFVYNLHYNSDLSILLYPKTTLNTMSKKPFRNDLYCDRYCQMAFVDLFDNSKLDKHLGIKIYRELLNREPR